MFEVSTETEKFSTEKQGQARPRRDKSVPRIVDRKFGKVAKVLWRKPAAEIATIAKCDERTAKRILRGEVVVPASVVLAANHEMLRPQG